MEPLLAEEEAAEGAAKWPEIASILALAECVIVLGRLNFFGVKPHDDVADKFSRSFDKGLYHFNAIYGTNTWMDG